MTRFDENAFPVVFAMNPIGVVRSRGRERLRLQDPRPRRSVAAVASASAASLVDRDDDAEIAG